jgi:mono/diheme cytochrome c family protein
VAGMACGTGALTLGAAIYLALGLPNIAADRPPSDSETRWMTAALHASVRREAGTARSPLPDSDATIAAGRALYMDDCVGCHGAPGQPPSAFGAAFYPPAPQFPRIGSSLSPGEIFWTTKHGIRMSGMYPQSPRYSDAQIWSLAAYVQRLRSLAR